MKSIYTVMAVLIFLICAPALADNMNDPFQAVVAKYLAANPKPQLSEEARKYKVQAEFAVQEKQFDKAVALYGKALDIAPWWPDGHFNRALIFGETKKYQDAMSEMNRYLTLVPDAPDASAAQDKIYQWEESIRLEEQAKIDSVMSLDCSIQPITYYPSMDGHYEINRSLNTASGNLSTDRQLPLWLEVNNRELRVNFTINKWGDTRDVHMRINLESGQVHATYRGFCGFCDNGNDVVVGQCHDTSVAKRF